MDFVQKNSVLHSSNCRREELPGRSVKVKVIRWYYLHLSGVKRGNAWHIFLKSSEKEGKAHKIMDFFKHVDNILNQTEQILFTFHYLCVPELNRYYSHSITSVFQNWTDIIHIPLPVCSRSTWPSEHRRLHFRPSCSHQRHPLADLHIKGRQPTGHGGVVS